MEALKPIMQDFLQRGVVISPSLAGVGENGRFGDQISVYLDQECKEFASLQWTDGGVHEMFGDIPFLLRLPEAAVFEITASTAVWLAHQETGRPYVDKSFARKALNQVKQFCADFSFSSFVRLHMNATGFENMRALAYYQHMPETPFSHGHWHRPWVDYSLNDEKILGVSLGLYQLKTVDGKRYVFVTETGWQRYREIESFLNETGHLAHRIRLLHPPWFNLSKDFTKVVKEFTPEWTPQRRDFPDWISIEQGMHALDSGCADGLFTFEGGLAKRVGPPGPIVALDPSRGILTQAKQRSGRRRMTWVEFVQGKTEELPFENDTFDAAVDVAFLHFTDKTAALAEIVRVVKPGGMAASFLPLPVHFEAPFSRDQFQPLLGIARKSG